MSSILRYYSESFKLCVISRIERGELSIVQARKLYNIGGSSTISCWIKKYNKDELLPISPKDWHKEVTIYARKAL